MTASDKKSSDDNGYVNEGQNSLTNALDQILLKALKDVILCVVDPERMNDMNHISSGPEAGKLITALREFVSSIARSSESMTVVEVSLVREGNVFPSTQQNEKEVSLPTTKSQGDKILDDEPRQLLLSCLSEKQQKFQDKLLKGLHKYVFNTMPIRMLSFEPHGLSLKITLLERGGVYERLESEVRRRMHEKDHCPIYRKLWRNQNFFNFKETDEEAIERLVFNYSKYAVLSHTWLRVSCEVTYGDWNKGIFNAQDLGYQKLVNFCKAAWNDRNLTFGWMDTVCINKESSSELDESIRSMYNWYRRADVCITYLADTETISNMHDDRWFTRGWTLQELLAPRSTMFYNNQWKRLVKDSYNDYENADIMEQITRKTTISKKELSSIHNTSISRRMRLAATRDVTREEDVAYSLMGIFNVSISVAYGEGAKRAFFRLLQEILASTEDVLDIFNWSGDNPYPTAHASQILPPNPKSYLKSYIPSQYSHRSDLLPGRPMKPLALTHLGLHVPVILMPAISIEATFLWQPQNVPQAIGDYNAVVSIHVINPQMGSPLHPKANYSVLDKRIKNGVAGLQVPAWPLTLAVFNFSAYASSRNVVIENPCIAKVLPFSDDVATAKSEVYSRVMQTDEPVVFNLRNISVENDPTRLLEVHVMQQDELAKHGMHLVSLYL